MRRPNVIERVLWVSILAAAVAGCADPASSTDEGAGGGSEDGIDLGTDDDSCEELLVAYARGGCANEHRGEADDCDDVANAVAACALEHAEDVCDPSAHERDRIDGCIERSTRPAEGEMRASDAEAIVRMTREATSEIRQGRGALSLSPLELAAHAAAYGQGVNDADDSVFVCNDDCYGDTERGGCALEDCGSGTFWVGGEVEWTPSGVRSHVTVRDDSSEGTITWETSFDIEDDGAGLRGEVVLATEYISDGDSSRYSTTLHYDDACAAGGSLDVEVRSEIDGNTGVMPAHHTFDETCD